MTAGNSNEGASYILDLYPGAFAAYSMRKLSSSYGGPCIRVVRESDSAELDVGFSGGELDTGALLAFVGTNNGYVNIWYDQSGNNRNIFEDTHSKCGRIVFYGDIYKENGIPTIAIQSGTSGMLIPDFNVSSYRTKSIFIVANIDNPTSSVLSRLATSYSGSGSVGNEVLLDFYESGSYIRYFDGGASITYGIGSTRHRSIAAIRTSSSITLQVSSNPGSYSTAPVGSNVGSRDLKIWEENPNGEIPTNTQEYILYATDQTLNRQSILDNSSGYFGSA